MDPDLTFTFRPVSDYVDASLAQERMLAILSGFFGAVGLLLAAVGLYGVTSYSVNLRRKEIGIRLALGAAPRGIILLVFRRVTITIAAGVMAGALVGAWSSRALAALLYGVDPHDQVTFVAAAAVLGLVGTLAGVPPALGASRTDPGVVLRTE
jgi:ABC-type antimicrobial peptide transport system permease subunit